MPGGQRRSRLREVRASSPRRGWALTRFRGRVTAVSLVQTLTGAKTDSKKNCMTADLSTKAQLGAANLSDHVKTGQG
jgi:hypothetical protein